MYCRVAFFFLYVNVFVMISLWLWILGKKTTTLNVISLHQIKNAYSQHEFSVFMLILLT